MRQQAQKKTQKIQFKHRKKNFNHESGWTLTQVAQRSCEVSILGDIKNTPGRICKQPALAHLALTRELHSTTSRGTFQP